jgi:riboflavin kinase/FMN adenylyltransferase
MEVLAPSSEALKDLRHPVLTVGSFDGLHVAHQAILKEVSRRAKLVRGHSLVVTFDPHPRIVLDGVDAPALLTTLEEKLDLLQDRSIDYTLVWPFTRRLASWPAPRFVEEILWKRLGVREMVIGHNHAFGHDRQGRQQTLRDLGKRYHFTVTAIDPVLYRGDPISSTRIRRRLLSGDVVSAAEMLGRPYELEGRVVRGDGRGRELKYPTANLDIRERKLVPQNGVYAVRWKRASDSPGGLVNIGVRPTFDGKKRTLEIHFFDFQGSLYGERIHIQFIQKIRDERKFASGQNLTVQMKKDEQAARRLLAAG